MKGEGADEGEAVDVSEVYLSAEEEEGAEEEKEEHGAREVGVVHNVGWDWGEWRKDRESLVDTFVSAWMSEQSPPWHQVGCRRT